MTEPEDRFRRIKGCSVCTFTTGSQQNVVSLAYTFSISVFIDFWPKSKLDSGWQFFEKMSSHHNETEIHML